MVIRRLSLSLFSGARIRGLLIVCSLLTGLAAPAFSPVVAAGAACAPVVVAASSLRAVSYESSAQAAAAWLRLQQLPDGSFEMADFPGFETPDAILALAEAAQTTSTWSTPEARAGVESAANCGLTALDWIDDFAEGGLEAGDAARMVIYVAEPLGLSTTQFDPGNDGNGIDLEAIISNAEVGGSYGTFNGTLGVAIALRLMDKPVGAETVAIIRDAQHADGSWDYTGDLATETPSDINTTALSMIALVAAGAERDDAYLIRGVAYLATQQQPDGGFREAFNGDEVTNPNATALAILAIRAAGYDPDESLWRGLLQTSGAASLSALYVAPRDALLATQTIDGNYASPYDTYGLNTFATTEGIHGMLANWLTSTFALGLASVETPTTSSVPPTTTLVGVSGGSLANTGASDATPIGLLGGLCLVVGVSLLGLRRRRSNA
jgi:LPXTG-motif cell wall-anchored protein